MRLEYIGLSGPSGFLITLEGVEDMAYGEMAKVIPENGKHRYGRIILIDGGRVVLQVFEDTRGISLENASTYFTGRSMDVTLSKEVLSRVSDGADRPIDALDEIHLEEWRNVNDSAINSVSRKYPRGCIYTGISTIDDCAILIQGQKLPIFSGPGMKHNGLAAQIVWRAKVPNQDGKFAIAFAVMDVKDDTAEFFRRSSEEVGTLSQVVMFLNLASAPIIEHTLTPRCVLTVAKSLALKHGCHVLVVPTGTTSYCEALREFSSSKGGVPSHKGFPAYLYSDLASLYERVGMIHDRAGSVAQVLVLTIPGNDVTYPIPDLTSYITKGQIVPGRELDQRGIYPPITTLSSLSRLMKDGVGKGFAREDHYDVSNQLFASYSKAQDARSLISAIGEDEPSELDKQYLTFGNAFERRFVHQSLMDNRTIAETPDLERKLLTMLPGGELDRVNAKTIEAHYVEGAWRELFERKQS